MKRWHNILGSGPDRIKSSEIRSVPTLGRASYSQPELRIRPLLKPGARCFFARCMGVAATLGVALSATGTPSTGFCWSMHLAGLVVGVSEDGHARRLLGGSEPMDQGDSWVRWYVDKKKTASLRITSCTDMIVCELSIQLGSNADALAHGVSPTISEQFDPTEGFGNGHALHLGSLKSDVRSNMGAPSQIDSEDIWIYNRACTCELPEYMTIHFVSDMVTKVVFSAPAG